MLTAGGEVTDGSVYSCIVGDGMQQVKSRLSLSRTDRRYLYPPHLSPPASGTENKMSDCWEMGEGDERRKSNVENISSLEFSFRRANLSVTAVFSPPRRWGTLRHDDRALRLPLLQGIPVWQEVCSAWGKPLLCEMLREPVLQHLWGLQEAHWLQHQGRRSHSINHQLQASALKRN